MDSETQPNPKPNWLAAGLILLGGTVLFGSVALFYTPKHSQADILLIFGVGLGVGAILALASIGRLKVITILSLLASIILLVISVLTKEHNPKLSSMSFVNAFFALAGAIVPTLVSRTQTFLYDRGFRGMGFDVNSQHGFTGGNGSDSGWGGGDCGGDGGGGDCGG